MNLESGYIPVESGPPLRGLATSFPSTEIPENYSPRLDNVVVRDGIVRRRAGGVQLGQQLVGRVMAITEFGETGEDPSLVVLTAFRQYVYDPLTEEFVDLTPNQVSHTITNVVAGLPSSFVIATDMTSYFVAGRVFPVIGGANEGVYTVVSSSFGAGDTTINIAEVLSSGVVAGTIVVADDLTTEETDVISFVNITDTEGHRFLFTNGRDPPLTWDGDVSNEFEEWVPTYTDFLTCKVFCVFAEHLFMGDITSSSREPLLVAWSAAGDFDEFESDDAGAQLLYQLTSPIKAMKVLGDRLSIYSHDAIANATSIGFPAIFQFEVVIPEGTRLVSAGSITSINVGHIYPSEENFYLYDGSRGLRTLGDLIKSDYKERKNQELLYSAVTLNDFSKRTIYFAIPDIQGGTLLYTMEYDPFNLANVSWAREKYFDEVTALGFFINRDVELTWEDASWEEANMTWDEELGTWSEESEQLNFPIRAYGTPEGRVMIVTEGVLSDRGNGSVCTYETKDFKLKDIDRSLLVRWGEIETELEGTNVTIEVSVDRGASFLAINDANINNLVEEPTVYQLPIDVVGRTIRVRFSSSSNLRVRWVRVWGKPGGPQ